MNLEELKEYKKRLKLERCLCFGMSFVMALQLNSSLKEKDIMFINNFDNGIESEIDTPLSLVNVFQSMSKGYVVKQAEDLRTESGLTEENLEGKSIRARILRDVPLLEPTYEEKVAIICERDGYTYDQLDMICAGCVAEAYGDGNCYDEGYRNASVIVNRTHSNSYVCDVNKAFGENAGYSIYYQFIAPRQFSVYLHGSYKEYLGRIDLLAYQGAIDMFYSGIPSIDYLNFNNVPPKKGEYEQFDAPSGNYYYNHQKESDKIEDEKVRELVLALNKD